MGRKESDGHWSQVRWLTSLLQGPSFSETSDGMVGMDAVVCYFECKPSSSTNLVRSAFVLPEIGGSKRDSSLPF